jgi:cobalt-zinc-cadmium resistance protein CzcA
MLLERCVRAAVARRGWVLVATAFFVVAALVVSRQMTFDALPDITTNQVLVLTRAPGLTPEEVERRVTRPLEAVLGGLPGLVEHRSLSRYGISSITTVFEDDVDVFRARQMVRERVDTAVGLLPSSVEPPELGPVSGGLGEIFHLTLSSDARTTAELLELAQYQLGPLLREVPGVVEVNTWGGRRRSFDVVADAGALAQRGLSLEDLRRALEAATGARPAGALPSGGASQALVRAVSYPADVASLGAVVIPGGAGTPVRVSDVATLAESGVPRIGAATAGGRGETVYVMAQMLRGANALEVMRAIHDRWPQITSALPSDVHVGVVYDRSVLVEHTLGTVGRSLVEGGLLVVAVLLLTLGNLRAGLLVAAAIPLSMLGATLAMTAFGIPGNLMSLGAIDFGLVVDGAVVVMEQIFHRAATPSLPGQAAEGLTGAPSRGAFRALIAEASASVARPTFFGVLVIGLVYVPVLTLVGVDGKMFRPMALTVVFALATSLVLALSVIPAAAATLLRPRDVPSRPPWLVRGLEALYAPLLARVVRHPKLVVAASVATLAAGTWLYLRTGTELVPQLDEGDLVLQTTRAADISLEAAVEDGSRLENVARAAAPEVRDVVSRIGNPAVATDIMGLEQADVFILLHPRSTWRKGRTRDDVIADLARAFAASDPGVDLSFTQPIQMRFNELLGGAVTDVAISVYGDDLTVIRTSAERVLRALGDVPGLVDARLLVPADVEVIEVTPRPLEAGQRGLTPAAVLDAVQALRTGLDAGVTYDGPVRVPIRLRLANDVHAGSLASLTIPGPAGALVPLGAVADVSARPAPIAVSHQNGHRRLIVGFNVRGVELGRVVEAARARVDKAVPPAPGLRVVWGGQYESLEAATRRLTFILPVVVVLILGVLFVAFGGLRPSLVIFLNVPFACVGGMAALAVRGLPISMSAAIGFIALSGIAVLNGVVLVSRLLVLEREGRSPAEAAREAALARVRPVTMTALVAALGFLPMMLATGIGAEVQRPLATVVVGGLLSSTSLTLLVLPTLYPALAARRRAAVSPPPPARRLG